MINNKATLRKEQLISLWTRMCNTLSRDTSFLVEGSDGSPYYVLNISDGISLYISAQETTKGNTGWGIKIQDLFDGKHPNYPHWKLQERIIRDGYVKQCCSNCDYDDYREIDMRGPYIINFLDGDSTNHSLDNIALLCYNCFFIMKPTGKLLNTPKNTNQIKKKLQEVWEENDSE